MELVGNRVPALTGLLTVVSLALVFGAVGGFLPAGVLPRVGPLVAAVPHLNALFSAAAICSIVYGVRAIRNGRVGRHRIAMLTTTALWLASFSLGLMVYLLLHVAY
jgi:putative membrane protein